MAAGANAAFKHYAVLITGAGLNAIYVACTPPTPANRVLVVSKFVIALDGPSNVIYAVVGTGTATIGTTAGAAGSNRIVANYTINNGEVYTETGLVVPAGEQISVYGSAVTSAFLNVNVFGEEVDAS